MDGNTIPSETVATTLPSNITNPSAVSFFGIDLNVIIPLMIIVSILAVFSCIIFSKSQQELVKYGGPVFAAVIALGGILFGGDDPYNLRIAIAAIGLLGYALCYFLTWSLLSIINVKATKSANTGKSRLTITLPVNNIHPIDRRFLEELPANVADLTYVCAEIKELTDKFIIEFSNLTDDGNRDRALKVYFIKICYYLAMLIGGETRAHVRILKDAKYQRYISTFANDTNQKKANSGKMKDMSLDNKMISTSFSQRCSLIKLENLSLHEDGSNKKWQNYLMFALPQITHDNKPVFTMGISITRKISERLVFLNYCAIEQIIGTYIDSILDDPKCQLAEFVERFYFHNA